MAIKKKSTKKGLSRPRKGGAAKSRRQREQKKRLVALGMDEAVVARLNAREVLTLLKHPAKVAKAHSSRQQQQS